MLPKQIRFKLHFGPYRTPRFKIGAVVTDELRGEVKIIGLSDAPIPWPLSFHWRARSVVVYGALVRAIRSESAQAVAHWWGISVGTVRLIRRALGVPAINEGSKWLQRRYARTPEFQRNARKAWANAGTPERRAIAGKARLGRRHSAAARQKIAAANRRRVVTEESRRRRSEAAKRCGAWPPAAGRAWSAAEDELVRTLPPEHVVEQTGRTVQAVWFRRRTLGVTGTNGSARATARRWTPEEEKIAVSQPVPEAAKQLGRSQASIISRRSFLRMKRRLSKRRAGTIAP